MNAPKEIRVALIEDELEVRQGLSYIINQTDGFRCVGEFISYEKALAELTSAPDVLLSDIGLPGMKGDVGAALFKQKFPSTAIVMLTVHRDDERIFRSILAGASGYILKKEPPGKILDAIREVHAGGATMSAETAIKVLEAFRKLTPRRSDHEPLTEREEEILQELVKGNSYKSTADHLFISVHTVRFHIRSIYEKLHVHSKSQAVAKALKDRLL
jgi:DNA-binding NarL/FixJ family response regulator